MIWYKVKYVTILKNTPVGFSDTHKYIDKSIISFSIKISKNVTIISQYSCQLKYQTLYFSAEKYHINMTTPNNHWIVSTRMCYSINVTSYKKHTIL